MDEKLMRQAEESVKAKRGFRSNVITYISVNLGLVVIYLLTSMGGYFWPIWCIAGWGLGLLAHGLSVYGRLPGKTFEEETQIEYQRLKSKTNTDNEE